MTDLGRAITRVVVPTGMLGAGVSAADVASGIAAGATAIACDSGSTDSGPSYLARGVSKMNREAVRRDLMVLMGAAREAGIPLLIGSCGTAGTDGGVDWTCEIAVEVAAALGWAPKIALLYSEQRPVTLKAKLAQGKIHGLAPLGALSADVIDDCSHIVALMGPEPYIDALEAGADLILGGRTTDTAVLAAAALHCGAPAGSSWHAAKIAECGGQCTLNPRLGGVLMTVDEEGFTITPLNAANRCSPESVAAHLLYENTDPLRLVEPGGVVDASAADYVSVDGRSVRVSGSRWIPAPYTMKLEGAGGGAFQTLMLVGIEDPDVLAHLDMFHDNLLAALTDRVADMFPEEIGRFGLSLRLYGWNGVSGRPVPDGTAPPREIGAMLLVTAQSQELATRMAKACNPYFFHFPLRPEIELPSYAFPFTPAEVERGQVYEFKLNHVVETVDGLELVRTEWLDLGARAQEAALA